MGICITTEPGFDIKKDVITQVFYTDRFPEFNE